METQLEKLTSGMALPFHQRVCNYCHTLPKSVEWRTVNITEGLHVFHIAKRHKPHQRWEPIYVGTQDDPLYDERLTWEGKSDKMTQVRRRASSLSFFAACSFADVCVKRRKLANRDGEPFVCRRSGPRFVGPRLM